MLGPTPASGGCRVAAFSFAEVFPVVLAESIQGHIMAIV